MSNKSSVADDESISEMKVVLNNSFVQNKRKNKWRSMANQKPKYVLTNLKTENKIKPLVMRELFRTRNNSTLSTQNSRQKFLSSLLDKTTYNNLLKVNERNSSKYKLIKLKDLKMGRPNKKQTNIGSTIPLRFDSDNW